MSSSIISGDFKIFSMFFSFEVSLLIFSSAIKLFIKSFKVKNKSLSLLVKEFIKMNPEKQRKMLILFLIHDQESQFTAHIIYDLLTDQTFLFEISGTITFPYTKRSFYCRSSML